MIPVYEPDVTEEDVLAVTDAVRSGWVSSLGAYKELAAERLRARSSVRNVLLVSSGTAATHLLAHAVAWARPSVRKMIVPDNAYVAAYNAFRYGPEFDLIPVRSDLDTWNFDLDEVVQVASGLGPEEAAVLVVHALGNPVDVPALASRLPGYVIVEDNCEGFLGRYGPHGGLTGTACLASSVSFYGNKTVTCGEGGAVLSGDPELMLHLYLLHAQAQSPLRFVHGCLGYNYRMSNLHAALLYSQLGRLDGILAAKKRVYDGYRRGLTGIPGVAMQERSLHSLCWLVGIRVLGDDFVSAERYYSEAGIEVRPMFYPMSAHAHLLKFVNPLGEANSSRLNRECVVLPSSPRLTDEQVAHVCSVVRRRAAMVGSVSS